MKRLLLTLGVCLLALSVARAGVLPGDSSAYGKTLGGWMKLSWSWQLGGSKAGTVKNVSFLPIPAGEPSDEDPNIFVGEADVTLRSGNAFALPMFVWTGETYNNGTPDDDPAFPPESAFTGADVLVKLDGKAILSSLTDDMSEFYFGIQYFDSTIEYPEATSYGSIGANWVKGLGFVHTPLSPGRHTLELFVYSPDFGVGYANTWNITVTNR